MPGPDYKPNPPKPEDSLNQFCVKPPPDPLEPFGCPSCRNEPCLCPDLDTCSVEELDTEINRTPVAKLPTEEEANAQVEAQKRAMGLSDPFPPGHLGDYMVQVRAERDIYRDALKDLFQSIDQAAHAKAIEWDRHSPTMTAARKALGL